jgi:hypothetical protein
MDFAGTLVSQRQSYHGDRKTMTSQRVGETDMKRIKCGLVILYAMVLMGLCACGEEPMKETVTYETVSEEERAVVDLILNKSSLWESDCTEVGFSVHHGRTAFFTSHYKQACPNEYAGWTKWYYFNVEDGIFAEQDVRLERFITAGGFGRSYIPKWSASWSRSEKRNHLAQQYHAFLNETKSLTALR